MHTRYSTSTDAIHFSKKTNDEVKEIGLSPAALITMLLVPDRSYNKNVTCAALRCPRFWVPNGLAQKAAQKSENGLMQGSSFAHKQCTVDRRSGRVDKQQQQ